MHNHQTLYRLLLTLSGVGAVFALLAMFTSLLFPLCAVITILCYLVGTLDACVLGGAPLIASVFGFLQNIIPVWVVCYIVTFILQGPIENLARKLTNDPAPQMA